ncbi:VTT domain-containing protein [uncultured Paludibaculum sp.]|uniref:VTT domain-containing protein n=1 Tax=uncultured Paludibaculum sp. TaxID=1765020 RepID=UPI002AAB196A|nr:VTT domain-containing protein [uncultured Paludibaculum sp.]
MLREFIDFVLALKDPDALIQLLTTVFTGWWSYAMLFGIVFAETGLLVGFFLPGDSLLFTVGVVAGAGQLDLAGIIITLIIAALAGNSCGYFLGRFIGVRLFANPKSKIFRREHLDRTHAFYEKHGGKTIIYAQFVPIIRTFAAFVAGVAGMGLPRFLSFNVFGSVGWVTSMTLLGYKLGTFPLIRAHFEKVVVLIVLVSVVPVILQVLRSRRAPEAA